MCIHMNIRAVLKRFLMISCLIDAIFLVFSSLKDACICKKDYLHAIDVWIMFKKNTMVDYHDLYLKTHDSLLADVFEKFIDMWWEYQGWDLCHCFSSPRLSWDATLKMTGIALELISNTDTYLFVEKGMRWDKQIIDTWNHMIIVSQANISCTWTQIIYIVG